MNKPQIRFKGFKDEWQRLPLYSCGTFNPKTDLPPTFEYVDLESVVGTVMTHHRTEDKSSAPSRAQRLAKKGDIFYQTVRPYQKNNLLFELEENNYVFSTGYAQIRPIINGRFLFSILQKDSFVNEVLLNCTGTSYPAINSTVLSELHIAKPNSQEEQSNIGNYFKQIDEMIAELEREVSRLEKMKQASLQKMFPRPGASAPEIRFDGFTEPWAELRLGDIGAFRSNGVNKLSSPDEKSINLLNYMDVYNKLHVSPANSRYLMQVTATDRQISDCNVLAGDVFFTPSSETPEDIGHAMVVEYDLLNTCYSYHLMRFRPNAGIFFITFPNYSFESKEVREQLIFSAQGVQRYVLRKDHFENITLHVPSYQEQYKISEYFRNLDSLLSAKRQKLVKLRNIKQACLDKMFVNTSEL